MNHIRCFDASDAFPASQKLPSGDEGDGAVNHWFEELNSTQIGWGIDLEGPNQRRAMLAYCNIPVIHWIQKKDSVCVHWLCAFCASVRLLL